MNRVPPSFFPPSALRSCRLAASAFGLFLLGSTASLGGDQSTGNQRQVTLTLDYLATGYHAPYSYGIKLGIFKKHGIDLRLMPGTGSANTIQAVAADQSMFGQADAASLILAASRGISGATMVYQYLQSSGAGLMFKASAGISKPSDIAGHSIGYNVGAVTAAVIPLFLNKFGIPLNKVSLINITPATMMSAFANGQFDIAPTVSYDSFVTLRAAGLKLNGIFFRDFGFDLVSAGIIASPTALKDRELVRELAAAMTEAVEAAKIDPHAAAGANKAVFPASPAVDVQVVQLQTALALTVRAGADGSSNLGHLDKNAWRATLKIIQDTGMVSNDVDIDKLVDDTFVSRTRP